jgi:hypothetical protein
LRQKIHGEKKREAILIRDEWFGIVDYIFENAQEGGSDLIAAEYRFRNSLSWVVRSL